MMINNAPFIIDIGSSNTRIGYAGESTPKVISSTYTNEIKKKQVCAIEQGVISDWNLWEQFVQHIVSSLSSPVSSLFLTESPLNSNSNRDKAAQLMFEKLSIEQLCLENTAVVSLASIGKTTGVVVDSGSGDTTIVPVFESFALDKSSQKLEICGASITTMLSRLLKDRGNSTLDSNTVQDIKEKVGSVALTFAQEYTESDIIDYKLPDGNTIQIGSERFSCTEILFNPQISGKSFAKFFGSGSDVELNSFSDLPHEIWRSILHSDSSIRDELYNCIMLAGGNTLFPGLQERLYKGLKSIVPEDMNVDVVAHPDRQHAAWIGSSIFASSSEAQWITRDQYNEQGSTLFHRESM
jgi:actin-related protein